MLISAYLFSHMLLPEGSVPLDDIVSTCIGDATDDGTPELLAISGDGTLDTGERCGRFLLVCDGSAASDLDALGYIPPDKIRLRIDLGNRKPLKVQLGDVNGDGVNEVAVCVYKTAKFHPVMAKRPFFYDLDDGKLTPVWLGSRLSRPFDDYILSDIDSDGADEIISIERLENGSRIVTVYNWRGFGFERHTQSEPFDGELSFDSEVVGQAAQASQIGVLFSSQGKRTGLAFSLTVDKLVYTTIDTEEED